MPDDVAAALEQAGLRDEYDARPPYQRNDYLAWIDRGRREDTRAKRLAQMLAELGAADTYMGMAWRAGGGSGA